MKDTTQPTNTKTEESENCSAAPAKKSSSEPSPQTQFSPGENSSTTAVKQVSIALFSETKAHTWHLNSYDKLTLSLITTGLVRGITHTSIRSTCLTADQVTVSSVPVGKGVDAPRVDCLCWKKLVNRGFLEWLKEEPEDD
jgi:hypothetical protein